MTKMMWGKLYFLTSTVTKRQKWRKCMRTTLLWAKFSLCLRIILPLGTSGKEFGVFTHADFTFLFLRCVCLFFSLLVGGWRWGRTGASPRIVIRHSYPHTTQPKLERRHHKEWEENRINIYSRKLTAWGGLGSSFWEMFFFLFSLWAL